MSRDSHTKPLFDDGTVERVPFSRARRTGHRLRGLLSERLICPPVCHPLLSLCRQSDVNFHSIANEARKKDLNELCCNFFDKKDEEGKTRFERELERAKEQNIKVILLVEVDNMHSKILSSKYFRFDKASKVSPKAFNSILRALQAKYDISIEYCRKEDSARMIHDILYYHSREYLKTVE